MTFDEPLARQILAHIEAHPEEHEQSWYGMRTPCRTAFCVAGHAINMRAKEKGYTIGWVSSGDGQPILSAEYVTVAGSPYQRSIRLLAAHELGISEEDADVLFETCNTYANLVEMVDKLAQGEHLSHGDGW